MDSGMTSRRKYENITIKVKKFWQLPMGHNLPRSGSGYHNTKPKRHRTRSDSLRQALGESAWGSWISKPTTTKNPKSPTRGFVVMATHVSRNPTDLRSWR